MRTSFTFAFCAISGLLTFANASNIGNLALDKRAPPSKPAVAHFSACSPKQEKLITKALAG